MKVFLTGFVLAVLLSGCSVGLKQADSHKELSYDDIVKVMEAGWLGKDPRVTEAACAYRNGGKLSDRCTYDFTALLDDAQAGRFPVPSDYSLSPEQRTAIHMRIYLELYDTAIRRAEAAQRGVRMGCPEKLHGSVMHAVTPLEPGVVEVSCGTLEVDVPDDIAGFIGKPYQVGGM